MTRFPDLYAFLTGSPERKTPPSDRRGSHPTNGVSHDMETLGMVVATLSKGNPPLLFAVDKRPLPMIIREGRLTVGPALAERILAEAHYDGQRPIAPHHVTLLKEDMRRDRWTPGSQIAFGRLGGRFYLLNGRHRMTSVIESGRDIEFQVLLLDAADEADLASLYYRFDRRQRARSNAEVLAALKVSERFGLSKTMTRAVFDAALLVANGFERPNYQADPVGVRSDDARLATAEAWWAHGATYEGLIAEAPKHVKAKLTAAQIVAVGLVTVKYQPELAAEFWGGLARNDGLRRADPRSTLISDFATRAMVGGRTNGAIAVSFAWNAFCERRQLKIIKVFDNATVRLIGTPFDGRRR